MNKKLYGLLIYSFLFLFSESGFAQDGTLVDPTNSQVRNNAAALEIYSTNQGFLAPRVTLTALNTFNPPITAGGAVTSLLVYNSAGSLPFGYYYWDGSSWQRLVSGNGSFPTGSGTPDYLARWITSSTLGTGVTYDNGTNVGIGNSLPGAKLHLGAFNDNHLLLTSSNNAYGWRIDTRDNGAGSVPFRIFKRTAGVDTEVLTILNQNGNVGIGNITPGHQLSVGAATSDGQAVTIRGYSNSPASWKGGGAFGYTSAAVIMGELGGVAQLGGHNSTLTAWADLAINSGAGNVGIGNAAPGSGYKLDVTGNTRTSGKFFGHLNVDDTRSVNTAPTGYDNEVAFDFKQLSVLDAAPGSGTYGGLITMAPWSDNSGDASHQLLFNEGGIFWRQGQPAAATWDTWSQILTTAPGGGGTPNYLARWITANTLGIGVTYDNGTNVGIGTTVPAGKFDVRVAGAGGWDRFVVNTTSWWGDGGLGSPSGTAGTQYITIGEGGASGVMIYNPHVVWNTGNAAAAIRYGRGGGISAGEWWEAGVNASSGFHIRKNAVSATGIDILNNGNVGIGSVSPTGKLDVNGGASVLSNAYLDINRDGYARSGISWYSQSYPSWSTYMAQATQTSVGPHGDLTAPTGTFVNSWALRNYIEDAGGYGWTFESAANTISPAVKFEIRSSDGLFHSYGSGVVDDRLWVTQGRYSQYTWQNAAITTPSIEIVGDDADNGNDPTLVFHDYGYGGPRFRKTGYDLFLEDAFGDYTYNYYINGMPVRIEQNLYAPIMYDSNDNNYYVDPNGTTQLAQVGWGDSWTRTQTKDDVGAIGTAKSGFYQTSVPAPASSWYPGASSWQHFLDVRHSNTGNNYSMQIAGSFFDQDFWVRKTNNNPSQAWAKMLTTGNIASNAILNQFASAQSASFWIGGNARVTGQTHLSRDGSGECCSGGNYTLSLAEGGGNTPKIQFHTSGYHEGAIEMPTTSPRRFRLFDYQGVGTGLEMTGDFVNQNVEWNYATGANYTVGANSGQTVITNSTVTLTKTSGNATNNGYSVVLLVANVTASGNDITWANGVGGYQTVQSLGHGVAGYRVYLQRSTDNANWTTLISGAAMVGMQVGDYYMQYNGITSMVGISGDAFKFSNNVSLNYIDNVGAGTYYYRLLFETTGYNKSGGNYLISDRALSVVEIKR